MRHYPPPQQPQQPPPPQQAGSFQDPIYETLSSYKHDRRWSSNISTVSAPNLSAASAGRPRRGDPPPLPPKPRLMSLKPEVGYAHPNPGMTHEVGVTRTDERGYSVSFV
jgi:hypothetical protein